MGRNPANAELRKLVAKHPDWPAKKLARTAYAANQAAWTNLETCRTAVRAILGVLGDRKRKNSTDKSLFRKPRQAGEAWRDVIPASIEEVEGWGAIQIEGEVQALILSDIHFRFHDEQALEVALDFGAERKPNLILLNGDICDHYAQSVFLKDPKLRDFPEEVRQVKFFLTGLRKRFPKARIIYKLGNHEERFIAYMRHKACELIGIDEFEFASVFHLKENKIELVEDKRPIRLGKLNVIHGHEYRFQISSPVNPARGYFLRGKAHVLGGHFHATSQHSEKNIEQHVVSTWSTGCLCNLHPAFSPLNNWNHGFAFVMADRQGAFAVENKRIIEGKVY